MVGMMAGFRIRYVVGEDFAGRGNFWRRTNHRASSATSTAAIALEGPETMPKTTFGLSRSDGGMTSKLPTLAWSTRRHRWAPWRPGRATSGQARQRLSL